MASDDYIAGTIKIGWSISERDLGIAGIDRELTDAEKRALYNRIEDALTWALPKIVDVHIDGKEKPPVRVVFETLGDDEIEIDLAKVFGAWPGDESESDEELLDALRDMDEPGQSVLRRAMNHHGLREQLAMLQEECGELVAAVNRWRRGREGAFPALLEEIADVEILIDQMRLKFGAEIDAARARKLARLRERLG